MEAAPRLVCSQSRLVSLDEESRTVRHVISTATLDRYNRVVDVKGWKLSRFRENPVVFADHDYQLAKVIGRAQDVKVESDSLVATTEFDSAGLGNVAFRMVQAGMETGMNQGYEKLDEILKQLQA